MSVHVYICTCKLKCQPASQKQNIASKNISVANVQTTPSKKKNGIPLKNLGKMTLPLSNSHFNQIASFCQKRSLMSFTIKEMLIRWECVQLFNIFSKD